MNRQQENPHLERLQDEALRHGQIRKGSVRLCVQLLEDPHAVLVLKFLVGLVGIGLHRLEIGQGIGGSFLQQTIARVSVCVCKLDLSFQRSLHFRFCTYMDLRVFLIGELAEKASPVCDLDGDDACVCVCACVCERDENQE